MIFVRHTTESLLAMKLRHHTKNDSRAIVQLFESVFANSEGESEGTLIGRLANDLFEKTDECDLLNFVAEIDGQIIGSIFFSRLRFVDCIQAFLLAPVAVHSDHQRKGVGQALIRHGLNALRDEGASVALTYGDPEFYSKVGFRAISHETVMAPFELSQPEGWLGQSLVGNSIETLSGECTCVEAFREPAYW
ncbi:GNAT family N-acetyltransferase [Symmachiella dynata]|uniref:GNAT family N-acetyltransferase n=1 Tax=Symmachiella dynata TaxID=2527995 RepID=UPI003B846233